MRLLTPYWSTQRTTSTDLFNEMEKFFENFAQAPATQTERTYSPAYEITEGENYYLISADLPGVKKEDIKIEMNENVLTISGERKRDNKTASFKRSFSVPNTVDFEKIEANHEDGVLSIQLPKAAAMKARTIEIQSKAGDSSEKLNTPSH
ncbi:Hsp20/alpha crystallin family protein [uncultured Bdellovibrio sp.]|uniref:Hsp20/alpha crystallin family protein n=1 Tax=Bdellovibrio sp. HCB-162 TaxID=3394234 RepID=UPI0026011DDE|nr:Hsp20/alpha crystallin family protein [uncultured Bdellovibrio sp.]